MEPFKLDNHPKIKPGFKTPEGYFDGLTEKIMQGLPERHEARVVPLYRRTPVWLSAVAAIFIIALSLSLYFRMDATAQPDEAAIENYLVYHTNINSYDLMQNLDATDIKELEQSIALSDEAIEDYLSTQNTYDYEN